MAAKSSSGPGKIRVVADLADIDPDRLMDRMMFDTGVASRAWRTPSDGNIDDRVKACQSLWEACLEKGLTILIAAPSLAELLRGRPPRVPPRVGLVEVVPFDSPSAEKLGKVFPIDATRKIAHESGDEDSAQARSHTVVKADAMILACALQWKASCIVSLDPATMGKLAARASLAFRRPQEFRVPILQEPEEEASGEAAAVARPIAKPRRVKPPPTPD